MYIVKGHMQLRRVASSVFLLTLSLYILFPTADEILIHPLFGLFLSQVLNLPIVYGVLLSIGIYRGVGVACLLSALLIGGKPIYLKLKAKYQGPKRKLTKIEENK